MTGKGTPLPQLNRVLYKDDEVTPETVRRGLVLCVGLISLGREHSGTPGLLVVADPEKFVKIWKPGDFGDLQLAINVIALFGDKGKVINAGIELVPFKTIPKEYQDQWLPEAEMAQMGLTYQARK